MHKGHSKIHIYSNSTTKTSFTISTPLPPNDTEGHLKHLFFLHTSLCLKEFIKHFKAFIKSFKGQEKSAETLQSFLPLGDSRRKNVIKL